jgi:cellobiose transport system permease protein
MTVHLDAGTDGRPRTARRGPPDSPARRRRPSGGLGRLDMLVSPYLFISPFFILFAIFGAFPLVFTAWVSLRNWDLIGGDQGFVGLDNYRKVMTDDRFWTTVVNTFGIFFLSTVPQLLLALLMAYWLNNRLRARTFFRMGVLVPNITSVAAVAIVFTQLFGREFGLINYVLTTIGFHRVDWLAQRYASWAAIATMIDWRWTGYNALILLAAMQAIPRDLYESAALDGASGMRQFWGITVPLLRPTLIFCVVISTIGGLQIFVEPLLFQNGIGGGSLRQSQTIAMFLYEQGFSQFHLGYGAAIAWILFLIIMVASIVNFVIVRRLSSGFSGRRRP